MHTNDHNSIIRAAKALGASSDKRAKLIEERADIAAYLEATVAELKEVRERLREIDQEILDAESACRFELAEIAAIASKGGVVIRDEPQASLVREYQTFESKPLTYADFVRGGEAMARAPHCTVGGE